MKGTLRMFRQLQLASIIFIGLVFSTPSFANVKNQKVRDLYKAQCKDVGGEVNGFCMCSEKLGILAVAAEVVDVAVTTKKVDSSSFGIINPFVQTCSGKTLDTKSARQRLEKMLTLSREYTKDEVLLEEIRTLDEAGFLDPATFSQYLSNAKFRETMKAKFLDINNKYQKLTKLGAGKTLLSIGQEKAKLNAINMVQQLTDIDIAQAQILSTAVKNAVTSCMNGTNKKTLKQTVLDLGEKTLKKGAKALGRGLIAGVISSTALEGLSYVFGVDLTMYDPFQIAFGVTAMGDGTISGAIVREPSLLYYQEFDGYFDWGLDSGFEDSYTGKVAIMTMIAEARSNGDSYVHFLDY